MTPELLRVVGRYEILRLLGRGGMASVHLARQPALDREVALKELRSAQVKDAASAERFLNESRVAGALNHPSIVSMIEYFEHEGVPFIAMEYLERGSLRPLVGRHDAGAGRGGARQRAGRARRGGCAGDRAPRSQARERAGHGGRAREGRRLRDRQGDRAGPHDRFRTATGQIVGTPAYMAPEQITGGEITPQADLYATGLLAYELLAGRHPFAGTDAPMALLMRHLSDDPPPLASVRPDLPPGVVAWVHGMLAKEPAMRPVDAAAAWDRLEGVVSDALGPRWRRDAALTEPSVDPAAATEPALPSERSGIYSIVLPPLPMPVPTTSSAPEPSVPEPSVPEPSVPVHSHPLPAIPVPSEPGHSAPVHSHPVPAFPVPSEPALPAPHRRLRRRALLVALAGALILAIAAILYSTAPGEEPRAAPRPPAGRPIDARLREAVAPALAAGAKLSKELSSLAPGADPSDARDRWLAAVPATETARAAVRELRVTTASERLLRARAGRALSTQSEYLDIVRAALRIRIDDRQLDALGRLSARLVSRLERIEAAVPGASGTVAGAPRLKQWVRAELAAAETVPTTIPSAPAAPQPQPGFAPAPTATATATPIPTAEPTATPTAEPTPAPTVSGDEGVEQPAPPLPRRRRAARLRRHLEGLVAG